MCDGASGRGVCQVYVKVMINNDDIYILFNLKNISKYKTVTLISFL